MFVRLFVDENLDRMVPISRQPREKVQAIIGAYKRETDRHAGQAANRRFISDSCLRQFPEFGERARKRVRTYLKSCRRNKRSAADMMAAGMMATLSGGGVGGSSLLLANGAARPMPPHLTSALAEQILAQACDNENQNAKRLRLGLEPISQPLPPGHTERPASSIDPAGHSSPGQDAVCSTSANLFRPAFGPYQRSSSTTPAPTNNFGN